MKKHLLFLLALAASLILLTACGNDAPVQENPESPAISDSSETEQAAIPADGLAIVENGAAKFIMIRPEKATKAELALMLKLRNYFEEKTGVTLEVKDDWIKKGQEHDAEAFEILIGGTNYNETAAVKSAFTKDEMAVSVQGNKIVFYSNQDLGYHTLAETVDELFADCISGKSVVIPKDFHYSAEYVVRLAGLPVYEGKNIRMQTFDGGFENNILHIAGAREADYLDYCTKMKEAGFTLYAEHEAANNLFATFTDDDQVVNISYMYKTLSLCIVEEPLCALPPRAQDVTPTEAICEPAVRLVGQEFYTNSEEEAPVENAMCIIFRLSDGRLIVVDSGQTTKFVGQGDNYLLQNLREMSPDPDNITIAAWILTHAHGDHVGGFVELAEANIFSSGVLTLEHLIYNFESPDAYSFVESNGEPYTDVGRVKTFEKISFKNSPTKVITAHTGQVYHYADATVEILYTLDDFYPNKFNSHNTSSLAFRVTIADQTFMILGDISEAGSPVLVKNFGDYLKSDFVQIAHHGYSGGINSLYQAISAKTILWPGGYCDFKTLHVHNRNKLPMALATDLFIAGNDQPTITLPYTPTGNKQAAIDNAMAERTVLEKEKMDRLLSGK